MLGHGPGEQAVLELLLGGCALGHDLEIGRIDVAVVAVLHQHAAGDDRGGLAGAARIGQAVDDQQAKVFLARKSRNRSLVRAGRDHHFGEDGADCFCGRPIKRDVGGNDPAERGDRIAGQRLVPRIDQARPRRHAARIGVLDNHHGRVLPGKLARQFERGIGVVVVVVGKLLALKLPGLRDSVGERTVRHIERSVLVRVFTIAQRGDEAAGHRPRRRKLLRHVNAREPARDGRIVSRRLRIGLGRHCPPEIEPGPAVGALNFRDQRGIVRRIGHDCNVRVVLGRRSHHRRPADIDVLDHFIASGALGHGFAERVEVDHHQIDRTDIVFGHRGRVFGIVAHRQQAAVDFGVQRLDASVHHFGKAGQVRNVAHRQPGIAQCLGGAAGGNEIDAVRSQRLAQFDKPGLVGHREQRPSNLHVSHGLDPIASS